MMLLKTNAENIFWLGRYLARTQALCQAFPFKNNEEARIYAAAFALSATDAATLNELILDEQQPNSFRKQFHAAIENIQQLRGILSAEAYAELNQLIRQAKEHRHYICDVVGECQDILEAESPDIFLFFSLGHSVEQLDAQLRLQQDESVTLARLDHIFTSLSALGWESLAPIWVHLKYQPNHLSFYQFTDHLHFMLGVDA